MWETSRDSAARAQAVDPRFNVVLEASAGTGKTRVLVDRYINLLRSGVAPSNILAITFTRKAAAEMRERIMTTLRTAAAAGEIPPVRWRELRDRTADIAISTIDAFCLSLLREFPLEADLDPAFTIADETELPRLIDEALDRALRTCRSIARDDGHVALVFARLGERRVRAGLATLLNRRIVAPALLERFLTSSGARELDVETVPRRAAAALMETFGSMRGGFDRFVESGPLEPTFDLLARGLQQLQTSLDKGTLDTGSAQVVFSRTREHFLTQEGEPRTRCPYAKAVFACASDWQTHRDLVTGHAGAVRRVLDNYSRELNVLGSRGVWRMFRVAETEYRRTLDAHAVLDFSDLLRRALDLLRRMDDFAQSRYRLESRYHHVLVDEFQDTSRAQWELISLLVQSWGEGAGLAHTGPLQPSIFIVGDRKQSIYAFRDADVSVMREASRYLEGLRPEGDVRRSIARSFRAVPPVLAFINDLCDDIDKASDRSDAFEYGDMDRFPIDSPVSMEGEDTLGLVSGNTPEACAAATASEIARLLSSGATVRDRETGVRRAIRAGDIGILFRTRESHREFEAALERQGIHSYVYKGLGFFDADEVKDVLALVRYLADPASDLRAAALMRSRLFGISDEALRRLAPHLSDALSPPSTAMDGAGFSPKDRTALSEARAAMSRWLGMVDRAPAAEVVDLILSESAYGMELRGPGYQQARENLKKIRSLLRRIQNRGYSTFARIASHLDRLAVGDESNAAIDAFDAVNLMTIHAAKGLEFPVVFVVNLARGSGSRRQPVRLAADRSGAGASVSIGDFQSDLDVDHLEREREETKRLLYVALTRARDRLYLGTVLKDGVMQPGRGSLGEVLPRSFVECFSAAAGLTQWRSSAGGGHRFRVCANDPSWGGRPARHQPVAVDRDPDDFAPLAHEESVPRTVSSTPDLPQSGRVLGTLVHRMLERFGFEAEPVSLAPDEILQLLTEDAMLEIAGCQAKELSEKAVALYQTICAQPGLRSLYSAGDRWHEVPFAMKVDGSVCRGTIDCLIQTGPDRMTVIEFKTGRRHPEHELQLDLYCEAASRLFPGMTIDGRLVYPAEPAPA